MDQIAFYLLLSRACLAGRQPQRWTEPLPGRTGQGQGEPSPPPNASPWAPSLKKSFYCEKFMSHKISHFK